MQEQSNLLRCIYPWTKFEIVEDGRVWLCCPAWTRRCVGNIQEENIEQIWNGPMAQEFREKIIENKSEDICNGTCPSMVSNQYIDLAKVCNNNLGISEFLFQEIKERKTILKSWPSNYLLSNRGRCNLRCIMCYATYSTHSEEKSSFSDKMLEDILAHSSDGTKIILTTHGEPFVRQDAMQLMTSYDPKKHPKILFGIHSNGILFDREHWELIKHCNFDHVDISVDAATKNTYEKIRRNGSWETLYRNLHFIKSLKAQGLVHVLLINMTVMRSNYKEIPLFIKLGKELNADRIYFTNIRGQYGNENIFKPVDKVCIEELKDIINRLSYDELDSNVDILFLHDFIKRYC